MAIVHVGCVEFPTARKRYTQALRLVELHQACYQPPRLSTARRWRNEAPESFEFVLTAWCRISHDMEDGRCASLAKDLPTAVRRHYGWFRPTDEVLQAWESTRDIALALRCNCLQFGSPTTFAPTEENLSNFRRFFRTIQRDPFRLVWSPPAFWDRELVVQLCREMDLTAVFDPFVLDDEADWPVADFRFAYLKLLGRGRSCQRFSEPQLEALLHICRRFDTTYCIFGNAEMLKDATRFQRLVNELD